MAGLVPPLGEVFPPRSPMEIAAYDADDLYQGYSEHVPGDDLPGENHSAGYRWGALNRRRDRSGLPDGFDHLRAAHLTLTAEPRS